MSCKIRFFLPRFIITVLILSSFLLVNAQGKPKAYFKHDKVLREKSSSNKSPNITIVITVPKDKDSSDKNNPAVQDSLKKGKVIINANNSKSTVDLSNTRLPVQNEFTLDTLAKENVFNYVISVPRDLKDDKVLVLDLSAKTEKGDTIKSINESITILVKPLGSDTLTSNRNFEFWFFTGTNFDLFDGVKAEEFYFRANTLFRITDRFAGQIAFSRNRYYTVDSTTSTGTFNSRTPPTQFGDSLHTLSSGTYRRTGSQTTDPVGLQLDFLFKLTEDTVSNFFTTVGFDFSRLTVNLNNTYTYDTTYRLRTSRPDTVFGINNFGNTVLPSSYSYKKPLYNISVGLMWILDESEVNIKAQLTAGWSKYLDLISITQTKGNGTVYRFEEKGDPYMQLRMFATYKPLGISFGMETYIRRYSVPAFNFTLSKAFDIRGFIKNFTPVTGLKL
jgi:hypothetical protein